MAGGRNVNCTQCPWTKFRCFGKGVLVEPCPECGARVWFAELWMGEKPFRALATDAQTGLEPVVLVDSATFDASTGLRQGVSPAAGKASTETMRKAASERQARWRAKKAGQQATLPLREAA